MSFIFRNLKNFLYFILVAGVIVGLSLQLTSYYRVSNSWNVEDEVGFLITNGKHALRKSAKDEKTFLAENGSSVYSGDSLFTYRDAASVEFTSIKQKVTILPESAISIYRRNNQIQIYIERGFVTREPFEQKATIKTPKLVMYKLNQKNEFDYYKDDILLNGNSNLIKVLKVQEVLGENQPQLKINWEKGDPKKSREQNLWIELWWGVNKDHLSLFKTYPYESGQLIENLRSDQFYWQLQLKQKDQTLDKTHVSFWKIEDRGQIHLIYPNEGEVINEQLKMAGVNLQWSQSFDVRNSIVEVFSDDKLQNKVFEKKVDFENNLNYQPPKYGSYYWRVSSEDGKILSNARSLYFAPLVSNIEKIVDWDERCDENQFFYDEANLFISWKSKYQYPINKYKVTIRYFQYDPEKKENLPREESLFTNLTELFFKVDSRSTLRVSVQAFNAKMQRVGPALFRNFELTRRDSVQLLTFADHHKVLKNEFIADRNFSLQPDSASVSAAYLYEFQVLNKAGALLRKSYFEKGQQVQMAGLPIGHYKVEFHVKKKSLPHLFVSQYLQEKIHRGPASLTSLNLTQNIAIKLIPRLDYNLDQSSVKKSGLSKPPVIAPQVQDVQIKE